jgi:nicotinate-nucleotide adenylyltransferase
VTTAVFGGSFDPPHVAHLLVASYVLGVAGFERLLVVPVYEHVFEKPLSAFEERIELCRACFADLPRVEVSSVEAELPRPNYTVRLLERLRADRPGEALRLIIGSDVLAETARWHDFARVSELGPPYVVTRRGFERPELGPALLPEVSSTHVRELLARRDDPDAARELAFLVPQRVRARIAERGLYLGRGSA